MGLRDAQLRTELIDTAHTQHRMDTPTAPSMQNVAKRSNTKLLQGTLPRTTLALPYRIGSHILDLVMPFCTIFTTITKLLDGDAFESIKNEKMNLIFL